MKTIPCTGNTVRFADQKTARLVDVSICIVKDLAPEWIVTVLGQDKQPKGTCLVLSYVGDKGIPFACIRNYGSASYRSLRKKIGQEYEIEQPVVEQETEEHVQEKLAI